MQCFFNIIQKAKDDNIETLLYMEDDCIILPTFEIFCPLVMNNLPHYYEMLWCGPGAHGMDGNPTNHFKLEFPFVYRSELNLGMQMVVISHRMYDMLLELRDKPWINENPFIDITISHYYNKGNSPEYGRRYNYGCMPYWVCENAGYSYNEHKVFERKEFTLWKDYIGLDNV